MCSSHCLPSKSYLKYAENFCPFLPQFNTKFDTGILFFHVHHFLGMQKSHVDIHLYLTRHCSTNTQATVLFHAGNDSTDSTQLYTLWWTFCDTNISVLHGQSEECLAWSVWKLPDCSKLKILYHIRPNKTIKISTLYNSGLNERMTLAQLIQKFPTLYQTRSFIMFTRPLLNSLL